MKNCSKVQGTKERERTKNNAIKEAMPKERQKNERQTGNNQERKEDREKDKHK